MASSYSLGEQQIRLALRNQHLRHHRDSGDTLVVDELGLAHSRARVDVAVIKGCIHGYEIKSASDKLTRLPRQLEFYRKSLQRLTLVIATHHLTACVDQVPEWCGVLEAIRGPRGGMKLRRIRHSRWNPDLDPFMLAHLLWHDEARNALAELGMGGHYLKGSRKDLYRRLVTNVSVSELAALIRRSMLKRQDWRAPVTPA